MGRESRWRGHARYTLATALLAVVCLLVSGVAYYGFLVAILLWLEFTAVELWRSGASPHHPRTSTRRHAG